MEVHYDNPELLEDIIDSSGVRIYYVNKSRPIQVGFFDIGDPMIALTDRPVGEGVREHTFECGGECSATVLPDGGVTVLRSTLHMHRTGIQSTSELIHNGTVVNKATVEYFDFAQQGAQLVQAEPFKILPGDAFRVRCTYRSPPNNTTKFGLASSSEMCIASLLYYPRPILGQDGEYELPWMCGYQYVEPCSADYTARTLADEGELGRTFGNMLPQVSSGLVQTDTPRSFSNSIQCPLAASPPPGDTSSSGNDSSAGAPFVGVRLWASLVLVAIAAVLR
jgi:Copper type II ascorbate-dependent monooxygenase, C-terminal domain